MDFFTLVLTTREIKFKKLEDKMMEYDAKSEESITKSIRNGTCR